jgi:MFS family permease
MHSTTVAAAPEKKPGVLINRNYALLWLGQTISFLGDFVFNTALVLWIGLDLAAGQSWAPLAVAGLLVAATAPVLLVGPLAGVFVDRWDKRRTMITASLVSAILVALLLPASGAIEVPYLRQLTGFDATAMPFEWRLGAIYAAVFLVNAFGQFFNPAMIALIGDIVPEAVQPRASGLLQVSTSLAIIAGPPLASILLPVFGPQWALLVDSASFLVGFLLLLAVRAPGSARSVQAGERGHVGREFFAGLRFFFGSRVLVTLIIGVSIAMLGFGALNALDVFFVTQNLHTPKEFYGFTGTAMAIGALAGAIVAGGLAPRIGLLRTFWISLGGMGVTMLVWSRMTDFYPALGVLAVAGVLQSFLNVAATPILLRITPKQLMGRVMAIMQPMMMFASLVSIGAAGYLASTVLEGFHAEVLGMSFGPIDSILTAAGALALLGGLFAMVALRGVRLPGPTQEAESPAPLQVSAEPVSELTAV